VVANLRCFRFYRQIKAGGQTIKAGGLAVDEGGVLLKSSTVDVLTLFLDTGAGYTGNVLAISGMQVTTVFGCLCLLIPLCHHYRCATLRL
jgi:hypothetical protein